MKTFSRILADLALLPISGCIFPDNRDFSHDPASSSANLSGHNKSIRTVERKKTFKPRLGEIGMKG
ncbi:MAG TPA: hypothetical protein VG347_07765 [Verrucomicrobiae bacterium]|nr:hypothetical protein [Verrucomicrobiae bacterium]